MLPTLRATVMAAAETVPETPKPVATAQRIVESDAQAVAVAAVPALGVLFDLVCLFVCLFAFGLFRFGVWGLGFRVRGLGFRIWGLGVEDCGFRV